jgi:hypothetical protein
MSGRAACHHRHVSEEPDADADRLRPSDAVPEPDGFLLAPSTPGTWDVLPSPPKPWPTLSRRNEDVALTVHAPQPVPASEPRVAAGEEGDLYRSRTVFQMLGRLFATIGYELRGGTGPESPDLYSGGGMLAVGILAAVVAFMIFIGNAVAGSATGIVVGGSLSLLAVALGIIGGRRFRRKDLGG